MNLAARNGERDVVERDGRAERLAQAADLDRRRLLILAGPRAPVPAGHAGHNDAAGRGDDRRAPSAFVPAGSGPVCCRCLPAAISYPSGTVPLRAE